MDYGFQASQLIKWIDAAVWTPSLQTFWRLVSKRINFQLAT